MLAAAKRYNRRSRRATSDSYGPFSADTDIKLYLVGDSAYPRANVIDVLKRCIRHYNFNEL